MKTDNHHSTIRHLPLIAAVLGASALTPVAANAAGFYIQEQSVSGLGAAFSGSTTNLNDASTIYFNPAGMTKLDGTRAQAGGHILVPKSSLTDRGSTTLGGGAVGGNDGGNPYEPTLVPNGFVSHQVNDKVWVGVAVTAPFGLHNKYDPGWFGRYDSIETDLKVIDVQPTVAYKFNDMLSVAGGLNIQHADARLTSAARASLAFSEGVSTLEGNDYAMGFTGGLQFRPLEGTTIGASYRSAISHELEGFISTTGTTVANFTTAGQANLDLPAIATVGVSQDVGERLTLMGQATWFEWSNFEDIRAVTTDTFTIAALGITRNPGDLVSNTVQGYEDTWAFSAGAEYKMNDEWTVRGGMQFDETPTVDEYRTSRTPDGDRTWLSGGATYQINDRMALDMAATYIWVDEGTIDVNRNNSFSAATQTEVHADTQGQVGIVALGFNYKF